MVGYDLEARSLSELKQLQKDIARAISTYQDRQRAEARAKEEAIAREMSYSLAELAELAGSEGKPGRVPAAPKCRPPENVAVTWSGRGRKLLRFVDALEAGKTAEDLAIG